MYARSYGRARGGSAIIFFLFFLRRFKETNNAKKKEKQKNRHKAIGERSRFVYRAMEETRRTVELLLEVNLGGDGREDRHEGEKGEKLRHCWCCCLFYGAITRAQKEMLFAHVASSRTSFSSFVEWQEIKLLRFFFFSAHFHKLPFGGYRFPLF